MVGEWHMLHNLAPCKRLGLTWSSTAEQIWQQICGCSAFGCPDMHTPGCVSSYGRLQATNTNTQSKSSQPTKAVSSL
jgi:hypothetical protein